MRLGYGDLRDPGYPIGYFSVSSLDARLRPGVGFTAVVIPSESCIDRPFRIVTGLSGA